jgi:hypothetical protein
MRIKKLGAAIVNVGLAILVGIAIFSLWLTYKYPAFKRLPLSTTTVIPSVDTAPVPPSAARAPATANSPARTIDWDDLLPAGERGKPVTMPAPLHGSLGENAEKAAQMTGSRVNLALNGEHVRLPGFIVPLELDARGRVRKLLVAPYVGACIHVPAPPPNQIVYVEVDAPVEANLYDPYWITGRMRVSWSKTAMATSVYTLRAEKIEPYK